MFPILSSLLTILSSRVCVKLNILKSSQNIQKVLEKFSSFKIQMSCDTDSLMLNHRAVNISRIIFIHLLGCARKLLCIMQVLRHSSGVMTK